MNFNFEKITALMIAVILLVGACAVALSSCKQKGNNADGGTETESDADVSQTSEEEETQPDETESESSEESEEETQTDETEEDTDDTQESDSDTSQDDSFADRIIIAEKENARFSIVIAENIGNNETLRDTVDALVRLIVSTTGAAPEILTPSAEEYDADANQILIGDTGYAESNAVYSEIGYGEWTLRFNGN